MQNWFFGMSVRGLRSNDPRLDHSRISVVAATLLGEYSYGCAVFDLYSAVSHLVHALCHTR